MKLDAKWTVSGVVTEARELKSQKNAEWRGYVGKIGALGVTVEVSIPNHQMFTRFASGVPCTVTGHFEPNGNNLRLIVDTFELQQAAGAEPTKTKAV